jgi:hypothetical protein
METGRPTAYNEQLLENARKYLEEYESHGDMIPSNEGLCDVIKINRSTLYRWRDEEGKEAFKDILDAINRKQQRVLINKGLSNDFNSAITKLVLGKHGYHEKQQQEISGPEGKPIETASVINFIPVSRDDK